MFNISLSHNDLDGYGSQFPIRVTHIDVNYYNIGYDEIAETLTGIDNHDYPKGTQLFVTDLNFSKDNAKQLIDMADRFDIVYIDHHLYDDEILEMFKNSSIEFVHDTSKSATLLSYEYFIKDDTILNVCDEQFEHLIQCINAYDIWLLDSPFWDEGFKLNNVFWDMTANSFNSHVINSGFEITDYISNRGNELSSNAKQYFDIIPKVVNDKGIMTMADSYMSFTQFLLPDYNYYMNVTSYKTLSFRTKDLEENVALKFKNDLCDYALTLDNVISSGGHMNAFGITINKQMTEEQHRTLVQKLFNKFNELQSL